MVVVTAWFDGSVLVVMCGVAGSGKTTVGKLVASRLGVPYADADDFHPEANRRKMAAGVPLTDVDRLPWLAAIAAWLDDRIAAGESAVVSCSALKRDYRDFLRAERPEVRLVLLNIDPAVAHQRLSRRTGHFFPKSLGQTQFADFEKPTPDEPILVVDAAPPPDEVATAVISGLRAA